MTACALVILAVVLGQPQTASREAAAIEAAKKAIAQQIDPALPRTTFESWLRGPAGAKAVDRQSQPGSGARLPDVRAGPGQPGRQS